VPVRHELHAPGTPPEVLAAHLAAYPGLVPESSARLRRVLFDTFDWRLHAAGFTLESQERDGEATLVLRDLAGATVAAQPVHDGPPAGPVTDRIAPLLGLRALMPRATADVERTVHRWLNDDQKTVARVVHECSAFGPTGASSRVRIEPVRGYDRAADRLAAVLGAELGLVEADGSDALELFVAAGCRPGDYSSKLRLELHPDRPADDAFAAIFTHLLSAMERNEPGLRADIDTEFLHDFRVAARRTRSLLPVARPVFSPDALDPFATAFKAVAGATGPARDFDVHLLDFDDMRHALAVDWWPHLEPLRDFLAVHRLQARTELLAMLDGPVWAALRRDWRAFLSSAPAAGADGGLAVPTVGTLGARAVRKAHRTLVKHGRRIDDDSPPAALHDLRKRAKVLRYRLEAFGPALTGDTDAAVRELKGLQDVLGRYQDGEVQIATLQRFAEQMAAERIGGPDTLLAMGVLVGHLFDSQRTARDEFAGAFERFDRPRTRRLYDDLTAAAAAAAAAADDEEVSP
jgi:CHAD domain-containing protein